MKFKSNAPLYILVDREIHEVYDLLKWGKWMEDHDRHVGTTSVGDTVVSTVFLGLDHGFGGEGAPLLFETMTFDKSPDGKCRVEGRYATYAEALEGHNRVVSELGGSNVVEVEYGQIKRKYRAD